MTFRRLGGDRRASVAVEGALIVSLVLLPMIFAVATVGQVLSTQVRLDRGLHSAWLYAMGTPGATNAGVKAAAENGYGSGNPAVTATGEIACFCIPLTGTRIQGTRQVCTYTCNNNQVLRTFVTATLSATAGLALPPPANVLSRTLTSSGWAQVVR